MRSAVANAGEVELIPWDRISSLETERSGTMGMSVLVGVALGLAVGTAIALAKTDFWALEDQTQRASATIAVSTLSGAALGALIGHHRKWRTIYPPAMREDGR